MINTCIETRLIGLYLVESVSSILQFYHILESSYIYLIILFYEHEFKEILFILDNSGARAVASGHQRTRRPTRSTYELILWNVHESKIHAYLFIITFHHDSTHVCSFK